MENTQTDLVIIVIIGSLIMIMIVFFIVLFVLMHQKKVMAHKTELIRKESEFQKNLLSATLEAAEEERRRVSSNLHDDLGVTMQLLFRKVEKIASEPDREKAKQELFPESKVLINESIQIIRNVTNDLRSMGVEKYGFDFAMESLAESINQSGEINMEYESEIETLPLDQKNHVHLFRILKELLNNTLKYSGANEIKVNGYSDQNYRFIIRHNGKAISNEQIKAYTENSNGIGLKSIAARSQLIGVKINYDPSGFIEVSL